MSRAFWSALHNEISKYSRHKFPYLGIIAVILMAVFWVQGFPLMTGVEGATGFTVAIMGTIAAVTLVVPFFSVIFASVLMASETAAGTYRNILSRPISRTEFLTAKIVFAFGYMLLLLVVEVVTVVGVALTQYSFGPVVEYGETVATFGSLLGASGLALLLTLPPLLALVSFGIMVSTVSKSLVNAVGIAIGTMVAIEPIKNFVHWGKWHLSDYVVTTYLDKPLSIANRAAMGVDTEWMSEGWLRSDLGWGLMLSLAVTVAFLGISYFTFLRRDLNFS